MEVDLLQAALDYADLGYRVFPLRPGTKLPASENGCLDATTDAALIEQTWATTPYNIGIATDGLIVVDIDGHANPWLAALGERMYDFAGCPTCRTPRGGSHRYFRQPEGDWRNTASVLAPGVDTRSDGGYVVAPPSYLENGGGYQWIEEQELTSDLPLPPAWLTDRLRTNRTAEGPRVTVKESGEGNPIPSGQRNAALASLAGSMRRIGMTQAEIVASLHVTNCGRCVPPLPESEVKAIARSICRYSPDQAATAAAEHHWDQMAGPKPPEAFPQELAKPPGFLASVIDYNLAGAHREQPILALAGALALLSTITGRKIQDDAGTRTNLYILGVAGSGSGKERARVVNKELLFGAGHGDMVGPESPASASGVVSAVQHQPAILFQWDEMGRLLATLQGRYAGPHLANVLTVLMKLFTSSGSVFLSDAYADRKRNNHINQPHAVLYGTTVPKNLYENLSEDSISDGFMGRLLIFESETPHPDYKEPRVADATDLIDFIREWTEQSGGNLSGENPTPPVMPTEAAAKQAWADFREECLAAERDADSNAPLWTRAVEKARKLALLHACSRRCEAVDLDAAEWGRDLSRHLTRKLAALGDSQVAGGSFDAACIKAKQWLAGRAGGVATMREFKRSMRYLRNQRQAEEIIKWLTECGWLIVYEEQRTSGGRPSVKVRAIDVPDDSFGHSESGTNSFGHGTTAAAV